MVGPKKEKICGRWIQRVPIHRIQEGSRVTIQGEGGKEKEVEGRSTREK